ncbi:WD40-repeat-containing domain protein [Lipomyces japonicus]|uniref:WD40-repeat-containing domain protein n=1 Tax=Lipomyces japonicus TaxID=56871 RepID=UPI0034CD4CE0
MKSLVKYTFIGANRVPGAAVVNPLNGIVAFAADRYVALWDPKDNVRGVRTLLKGHLDAVSAIHFTKTGHIVSGSADGVVKVWQTEPGHVNGHADEFFSYACVATLNFHARTINTITSTTTTTTTTTNSRAGAGSKIHLFIGSGDAKVSVWNLERIIQSIVGHDQNNKDIDIEPEQVIDLGIGFFPLSLALETIHTAKSNLSAHVLAIGATSTKIKVFVSHDVSKPVKFANIATLKGHEDWVHGLAFKWHVTRQGKSVLYLASGSQDRYIRLWKILPLAEYKKVHETSFLAASDPILSSTTYKFTIEPRHDHGNDDDGRSYSRTTIGALAAGVASGVSDIKLVDDEPYTSSPLSHLISQNQHHRVEDFSSNANLKEEYIIVYDALLMGHDDWIFALSWHPSPSDIRLLSSSADSSLMIWAPDETSGIWVSTTRLGDVSIKGASSATGSSGGFWVALWDSSERPQWIATVGKSGGFRVWQAEQELEHGIDDKTDDDSLQQQSRWKPVPAITGHARETTDVSWSPNGEYLLTTSLDQTTRLLANWQDGNHESKGWHEFARAQIHGYDMLLVESLSSTQFVSAGDEKVLRVFDMPRGVETLLHNLCQFSVSSVENLPDAASVPSLGLSNKAITASAAATIEPGNIDNDNDELWDQQQPDSSSSSSSSSFAIISQLTEPPLESHLQRHTLFPEIDKLYGHGYEISAAAVTHNGSLLATTCRANNATHAVVRLFDTQSWHELRPALAPAHALTVTSLSFSHDDRFLLSVGRDRLFVVWEAQAGGQGQKYEIQHLGAKGHTRIIWDGAWAPTGLAGHAYVFVTVSRDKTIKVWALQSSGTHDGANTWALKATQKLAVAGTAVQFLPGLQAADDGSALLAAGLENGNVHVYKLSAATVDGGIKIELLKEIDKAVVPNQRINCVAWRPRPRADTSDTRDAAYDLAVASDDSSVRIYSLF